MLLLNNAEAQASGTTVTNANNSETNSDLLDEVAIGANMTATFDSTTAAHGSNTYKLALTSTATAITYVGWSPTQFGAAQTHVYGAFYFRTNVASIASSIRLVEFRRSGANVARIGCVNGNQGFQFRIGDTATGTITGTLSANTWYRCEFDVLFGASGLVTLNVYTGDSTTLQGTGGISTPTAIGTDCDGVRFGFNTANFSSTSGDFIVLDSINVNDSALPGPGPYTKTTWPPAGAGPVLHTVNSPLRLA